MLPADTGPDGEAAVAAGWVVRVESQAAVGNVGFQGHGAVLGPLTDRWPASGRA